MSGVEFDYTPEERAAYEAGARMGFTFAAEASAEGLAVIYFGAIRRAAEIARQADNERIDYARFHDWESETVAIAVADATRRAIRAAIGSDKA